MTLRNYAGRIAPATLELDPDSGKLIVIFDGNPRTPEDAGRDQLEIIEATPEEREALRAAGYDLSSEMWEQEQVILAEMRSRAAEDWRVLKDKPLTERMICAATLRALGVQFSVGDLINIDREGASSDIDVAFRDATFQVMEALGGRRRDDELRSYQRLVDGAKTLDEVMDDSRVESDTTEGMPFFTRQTSHEELIEIVASALGRKATKYGSRGCSGLDAVVYINQRVALHRGSVPPSAESLEKIRAQGWRSVTVFVWPVAWVLLANDFAPAWLRERLGEPRDEWVRGDLGRGDRIFDLGGKPEVEFTTERGAGPVEKSGDQHDDASEREAKSDTEELAGRLAHLLTSRQVHFDVLQAMDEADNRNVFTQDLVVQAVLARSLNLLDGFSAMIERQNLLCAAVLLRLQLDSIMRLYALNLVADTEPLLVALLDGTPLAKIKDRDGKPLRDRHLREQVSKIYPFVGPVYERTSGFVHLSMPHMLSTVRGVPEERVVSFCIPMSGNQPWRPEEFIEVVDAFREATRALLSLCHDWVLRKREVGAERERRQRENAAR